MVSWVHCEFTHFVHYSSPLRKAGPFKHTLRDRHHGTAPVVWQWQHATNSDLLGCSGRAFVTKKCSPWPSRNTSHLQSPAQHQPQDDRLSEYHSDFINDIIHIYIHYIIYIISRYTMTYEWQRLSNWLITKICLWQCQNQVIFCLHRSL